MSQYTIISNGVAGQIRAEMHAGAVAVPWHLLEGSRLDGTTWSKPDGSAYSAEERRHHIAPLEFLSRFSRDEMRGVIGMALGVAVTDPMLDAWLIILKLSTAQKIASDGEASVVLPALFGSARSAELLAPS